MRIASITMDTMQSFAMPEFSPTVVQKNFSVWEEEGSANLPLDQPMRSQSQIVIAEMMGLPRSKKQEHDGSICIVM